MYDFLTGTRWIQLQTRLGNDIGNEQLEKILPHKLKGLDEQIRRLTGPELQECEVRRETDAEYPNIYNCHGMTFASRRTGIYEDFDVATLLRDDGYGLVTIDDVDVGDIALYFAKNASNREELIHSGIVVRVNRGIGIRATVPIVMSKWSDCGAEYIHPYHICIYTKIKEYTSCKFAREALGGKQKEILWKNL